MRGVLFCVGSNLFQRKIKTKLFGSVRSRDVALSLGILTSTERTAKHTIAFLGEINLIHGLVFYCTACTVDAVVVTGTNAGKSNCLTYLLQAFLKARS